MRPSSLLTLGCCLAVIGLSACDRNADTAAPAVPVDAAAPITTEPGGDSASMRYTCDGGYAVAIIGDTAHVTTADGREIELQRAADHSPPLFAGEALEFSVGDDGAVLGQDEGGPFPCREAA